MSLGITNIDPIKYDLLFERMLNPERVSLPDVDEDFDYLRRHEVIEYITQKYGKDHVAQIGTYTTLSSKIVLKDVGRILGIDHERINDLNKHLPSTNGKVMDLADAVEELPAFQKAKQQYPELFDLALQIQSMPRGAGIHACFPKGAIVKTKTGNVEIQNIKPEMEVYTHNGRLKPVAEIMTRQANNIVVLKTATNHKGTAVTDNHKYLSRHVETVTLPIKKNGREVSIEVLSTPEWKQVKDLTEKDYVCRQGLFLKKELKDLSPEEAKSRSLSGDFYVEDGNIWEKVVAVQQTNRNETVYNLSVYDDNSYTVDGLTVKNCGVQISPVPLDSNIPLMRGKKGETVTQYEGPNLEEIGFVKFDILGLKNLSVLRIAVDLIQERHGKFIDINNVEPEDPEVFEMIRRGDTQAIFQLESSGMTQVFTGLKKVTFDSLIAGVALYR